MRESIKGLFEGLSWLFIPSFDGTSLWSGIGKLVTMYFASILLGILPWAIIHEALNFPAHICWGIADGILMTVVWLSLIIGEQRPLPRNRPHDPEHPVHESAERMRIKKLASEVNDISSGRMIRIVIWTIVLVILIVVKFTLAGLIFVR